MTSEELRFQIIEIFQRNRQTPGGNYDESRFLDFLISPPASKNNIKNSFKGVRRYYRFFEEVELTFGICFSLSDQDRFYSIDQFVTKTTERIGKGRGNKIIVRQRIEEKSNYAIHVILTLIVTSIFFFFKVHLVSVIAAIGYVTAMWWILSSEVRSRRHNKRLSERINE